MASFLNDLAKPYVDKLINGVITESSYVCCFTCIAKDFEEEKARLEKERSTVKQRVDVATSRGEDVQANALSWEEEADKLIQEDTRTKQKSFFGFCSHCVWRYRRGKELTKKKEQIKRLIETGKELSIGLPARLPGVERYSSQNYIPFKSRESKYKELLDALKDDNSYVIGLKGMGGTGKTTLAKEVGKELKQSKQFTQIIDTTVSFSPNIKKIQDDIAGPLQLNFDDCNDSYRPKKLWSRLTNGEKILIILDDVWGDIDFNEIGIPYIDNHKGCRILVTTRNLLVCNRLGCRKTIQLDLLSEEDAWIMFKRHAGLHEISTKHLLDKGQKIANECKRLPIAIAAIASSLKGIQRSEEWEWALKSLQKHMPMHDVDVDDDLVKIYNCLKFSYDNMKNEKAKRLFLLCSVFQEDEKIPTERLTRLGIGGGLFGDDYVSYEDARSEVVISKNKLLDYCLLLEAKKSIVQMHDMVRDAAQWIANKEIQTVKLYDKNQKAMVERGTNIKYLLCEGKINDVCSFKLDGSKLEILIVSVHKEDKDCHDLKIKVPSSFFENSMGLRVFHLIYDKYSSLSLSLPHSIQSLKNIRSLLFANVVLGDISILGNLQSLETLDLDHCKIDELPHGITKLEKLKLLHLDFCKIASNNPFEVIEGCSSLEELYFLDSFNDFCQEITFPELQRFYITDYSSSEQDLSLKCVSFIREDEVFLSQTTLKYCMQEAEVVTLRRIKGGWRNIMPEIVPMVHGMNDLVRLNLRCISQLQCLIDTKHIDSHVSNVFSKLVVLMLEGMENLEELCNGPLSFNSLNSLKVLSIKDCKHLQSLFKCNLNLFNLKSVLLERCPMLISIFQQSTVVTLVLLETLEIIDCELLENIIIDEGKGEESRGEIVDGNDRKSQGSMFQKVKHLCIEKCPRFEVIFPFLSSHDLPALESITIKSCDKLKYIFCQDVKLGSLKTMKLDDIPNFIDIFPECNRIMTSPIKEPSSISGYASNPQAQSDPIKCNVFSWTDINCCGKKYGHKLRSTTSTKIPLVSEDQPQDNLMESNSYPLNIWEHAQCLSRQSHILCNIKEITLKNISKMKSVFILSIAPRMLLEDLRITNCDELKYIIINTEDHDNTGGNNWSTVFPKLKWVNVEDCEQLEYIIGHYTDGHQNHIEDHLHLPTLETFILRNLPSLVGMCPKKYHMTFPSLKHLKLKNCGDGNIIKNSNSYYLNTWERAQCLPRQSHILCNIKEIKLENISKMKSIFILSIAPIMLLETLTIRECDELKHIILDTGDDHDNTGGNNWGTVFPKLRRVEVEDCEQLEYIIGPYTDDHQNNTKNHLPALETFILCNLPSLVGMCPKQYHMTFPPLKYLTLKECSQVAFKSIGDFINHHSVTRYVDGTIIKELSGNVEHFCALESLKVDNSNVKDIFCLNEINEHQMNLGLQSIELHVLPMMTCLFVGPKNLFSLENLTRLKIKRCEKLKIVFPTSILRCLPQLVCIIIQECKELKHIIEDDLENKKSSNFMSTKKTCFPKLKTLVVMKCNKLKYVFPISICEELPELNLLMISNTDELEEIFGSEGDDQKVEIPNLKFVVFHNLPILSHAQGIQFEAVKYRSIHNCQQLSLASASTAYMESDIVGLYKYIYDSELCMHLRTLSKILQACQMSQIVKMKRTPKTEHEFVENVPDSEMPTNSEDLMNEQSMYQQRPLRETDTAVKSSKAKEISDEEETASTYSTSLSSSSSPLATTMHKISSQVNEISDEEGTASTYSTSVSSSSSPLATSMHKISSQCMKETMDESIQGGPMLETRNEPSIQLDVARKQKGIKISFEEGTYDKTITSSTHLEVGDGKICIPSVSIVNIKPATKYVDIGDSQEIIDINKLIEEDPLLALEKLLTGQVPISSTRILLQELKTLMDSSSDIDHLVSNQESKLKLISLFHGLNHHQELLPLNVKEFVEKVQNFFNDYIIKHATSQQVLKKHNQLLDSKTNFMKKLWSAKSRQVHIDGESSTANAQIHELSLQIDDLKSVVNKCDVQKEKLKAECTEWAQQSKELLYALVSTEVDVTEVERVMKLATEGFENLKSSFPTF